RPKSAALLALSPSSTTASSALLGMHPQFRQTPPSSWFSTTVTRAPNWAARMAATYPPGPAPRIAMCFGSAWPPAGKPRRVSGSVEGDGFAMLDRMVRPPLTGGRENGPLEHHGLMLISVRDSSGALPRPTAGFSTT